MNLSNLPDLLGDPGCKKGTGVAPCKQTNFEWLRGSVLGLATCWAQEGAPCQKPVCDLSLFAHHGDSISWVSFNTTTKGTLRTGVPKWKRPCCLAVLASALHRCLGLSHLLPAGRANSRRPTLSCFQIGSSHQLPSNWWCGLVIWKFGSGFPYTPWFPIYHQNQGFKSPNHQSKTPYWGNLKSGRNGQKQH